eukprot:TRINITY_DN29682_c0_g1_i1.p1 TRINITY_DN29682_c0_g1~~TRINITY_DN29682_c0_g1_i1.p1  ORF type:complete len:232 (-),score=12.00 TRINITY_DN29682_c0_g1_i1:279-974(-)
MDFGSGKFRIEVCDFSALSPWLAEVRTLYEASFPEMRDEFAELPDAAQFCRAICGQINAVEDCHWVLVRLADTPNPDDMNLVGMATFVVYHNSLFVFNFCVHPAFRQHGIGTRILRRIQYQAAALGLSALSGQVARDGRVRRFYERLGAEEQPMFSMGSDPPTQIRLIARFDSAAVSTCEETFSMEHGWAQKCGRFVRRAARYPSFWLAVAIGVSAACRVFRPLLGRTVSL